MVEKEDEKNTLYSACVQETPCVKNREQESGRLWKAQLCVLFRKDYEQLDMIAHKTSQVVSGLKNKGIEFLVLLGLFNAYEP